jgi:hypothetical protein
VLVGDAGAIPYVSNLPAIDIAGLGGLQDYPFARASRLGLAAAVEVLQRVPSERRPTLLALYPSWYKELPVWFGERLFETRARGNVICGDEHKVVYRANWAAFKDDFEPGPADDVRAELDFADIQSERASELRLLGGQNRVEMKLLERGDVPHGVWDGGRLLQQNARIEAVLRDLLPGRDLRLHFRLAPTQPALLVVNAAGKREFIELQPRDRWQEPVLSIPAGQVTSELTISLESTQGPLVLHHLWAAQARE